MNKILPYYDNLYRSTGAFIKPSGNILYVNKNHEQFAKKYCLESLDKRDLLLLRKWVELRGTQSCSNSDFLVFMLSFDKVEAIVKKVITTTSPIPHIRFYNYLLMNWQLNIYPKMIYNQEEDKIEYAYDNEFFRHSLDREKEEEILEIKSKVSLEDRHLFFK